MVCIVHGLLANQDDNIFMATCEANSLPSPPPSNNIVSTIVGLSAGANTVNQACVLVESAPPYCAVPVLHATAGEKDPHRAAVPPGWQTAFMPSRTTAKCSRVIPNSLHSISSPATIVGRHHRPLLAI